MLERPVIGGLFHALPRRWCRKGSAPGPGPHLAALLGQLSALQRSVLRLMVLEGLRQGPVAHSHQSDSAP